jgi:hypothetical protein
MPGSPRACYGPGIEIDVSGFQELAFNFGVDVRLTPIESHNSSRLMERYHSPLRWTYEKIRLYYRGIIDEVALSCAVLTTNQTLGPKGIVQLRLFRYYPVHLYPTAKSASSCAGHDLSP